MLFGASMFFTDYSMGAGELAKALEERGFESVWAPEHSHIPLSRESAFPSGGELPKQYCDVMDPFVSLTAAAVVTKTIKVGTGVCLVAQRDPIQTAKLVASLDQVSVGRTVPVRGRRRLERRRDGRPRHRVQVALQADARTH
jgi:alkanesulfonate monooxygenase SsuD/methylene tetrahydromethanopterin reductase-like flavin-dependent oxidoreductase (luciferase family)